MSQETAGLLTPRLSPGTLAITLIVISIFLVLLGAFLICKYTRCGEFGKTTAKYLGGNGETERGSNTTVLILSLFCPQGQLLRR